MSAWRGLTNPEQHRVTSIPGMAYCVVCGDEVCCWRVEPCRCCLAAEVERLTAERDALREKVQRVERLLDRCDQDTYDFHWGEGSPVVLTQYVRDALDGGEPDE